MRLLSAWLPALLVAALIFWLSSIPGLAITSGLADLILRKLAHMAVYAALAVASVRGLAASGVEGRRAIVGAFMIAVLYAISDEYHQTFVPRRHGAPTDVAIDAVGAAIGLAVLQRSPRLRRVVTA